MSGWRAETTTTKLLIEPPRCLKCHKKLAAPTDKWPVWRCARCGSEWSGPSEPVVVAPEVEQPNGHALIAGKNGTLLLVEWKPARGLFYIGGLPDTQPAHPNWHADDCIFRRFDVEWMSSGRENGYRRYDG